MNTEKTETLLAPSALITRTIDNLHPALDARSALAGFYKCCGERDRQDPKHHQWPRIRPGDEQFFDERALRACFAKGRFPCFVQGSMSKTGLLEKFRETKNAVLFATSSFWQGVDVRGEQLSCVIIDKLPFAVPTDPIVAARTRFIDENGGKSFFEYSVPNAIISLKQGIGRLIRSKTDKGVIALLDTRLRTKSYGRDFLSSLPRTRITAELKDVAIFLIDL